MEKMLNSVPGQGLEQFGLFRACLKKAKLISAGIDGKLVSQTRELFANYPNVEIQQGDCFEVMKSEMPFDLLFVDTGIRKILIPENWRENSI